MLATAPAVAQQTTAPAWPQPDSVWVPLFQEQVSRLMAAPGEERQDGAMQLITQYATYTDADGDPVFNFRSQVPSLLDVYRNEKDMGRRLLALSALNAIGDRAAFRKLAEWMPEERSERVRRQTLYVLSAHQK